MGTSGDISGTCGDLVGGPTKYFVTHNLCWGWVGLWQLQRCTIHNDSWRVDTVRGNFDRLWKFYAWSTEYFSYLLLKVIMALLIIMCNMLIQIHIYA